MHRYRLLLSLIIGTACSAGALYLAFRNVPLATLGAYIGSVHPLWTILAVLLVILNFIIRVWRWQLILADSATVPFWAAFHPLMIGFMMNCILPGRIGEIARPAILSRRERVPFAAGLATVATERAFDAVILIALFAWTMAGADISPEFHLDVAGLVLNRDMLIQLGKGTAELCVALIVGIAFVGFDTTRNGMIRMLESITRRVPSSIGGPLHRWFTTPLIQLIEKAALGFQMIKSPHKLVQCLLLSILVWAVAWMSYHAMVSGSPGIHLKMRETAVMMTIICFVIAIPSVPGFWGIWEAGGVFALSLFGVDPQDAAGFTLVNHAVQMFPVILIGLGSALVTGINIVHVSREIQAKPAAS